MPFLPASVFISSANKLNILKLLDGKYKNDYKGISGNSF